MKLRPPLTTKRRRPTETAHTSVTRTHASESPRLLADPDGTARRELVAVEAYFLAERRGFTPGCELDDWLAAEATVEARLHEAPLDRG